MLTRRRLLTGGTLLTAGSALPGAARTLADFSTPGFPGPGSPASMPGPPDYAFDIRPCALEIDARHTIKTTGYDGKVPGPLLRFREGQTVTIDVTNRSSEPEIVHWHGLFLPPDVDGAMEEGTPMIAPGEVRRISF